MNFQIECLAINHLGLWRLQLNRLHKSRERDYMKRRILLSVLIGVAFICGLSLSLYYIQTRPDTFSPASIPIALNNVNTLEVLGDLPGSELTPLFLVGQSYFILEYDGGIGIWNIEEGKQAFFLRHLPWRINWNGYDDGIISALAINSNSFIIASGSGIEGSAEGTTGKIILWDINTEKKLFSKEYSAAITSIAISNDGHLLAYSTGSKVYIYDIENKKIIQEFDTDQWIQDLSFTPKDNALLFSGTIGLGVWNINTGTSQILESESQDPAIFFTLSPTGNEAASWGSDASITIWDLEAGMAIAHLDEHEEKVKQVAFSPNGKFIASAGYDNVIYIWDTITLEKKYMLKNHSDDVWGLAFDPSSSLLASVGWDNKLILWDLSTGLEVKTFSTLGTPFGVVFSPDGSLLIANCESGTRIWGLKN